MKNICCKRLAGVSGVLAVLAVLGVLAVLVAAGCAKHTKTRFREPGDVVCMGNDPPLTPSECREAFRNRTRYPCSKPKEFRAKNGVCYRFP